MLVGTTLMTATCAGGAEPHYERYETDRSATDTTLDAVFPDPEWATAEASELGFDPETLDALAAEARSGGASCLLVVRHGRVAAEWYWHGTDASSRHQVFSITKAYTSTLVGIAQDEGLLDIDDPAAKYIPRWVGTPSETVTVRQLLSMVSGREAITAIHSDVAAEYYGSPDLTSDALDRDQLVPPGWLWALSEGDVQSLDAVLGSVTGMQPDAYAVDRLLGALGDSRTTLATDAAGNTVMGAFAQSTCQDVARLGHLILHRGNWNGRQVVSETWVDDATGRPSQDIVPAYGLLWWLNQPGTTQLDHVDGHSIGTFDLTHDQLVPDAPEDLVWSIGAYGQILQVHPATDTVVVRLGTSPDFFGRPALELTTRIVTDALQP